MLLMIGCPMGAAGSRLWRRTSPSGRGHLRPTRHGAERPHGEHRRVNRTTTPPTRSSDRDPRVGPVDMFASSGGAVNSLALMAKRPDLSTPWSRTSRRWPASSRTARPRQAATTDITRPTSGTVRAPRWPSSSPRRLRGRDPGRLHRAARAGSRPCSVCPPRTTATGTTFCSVRTSAGRRRTSRTSTR